MRHSNAVFLALVGAAFACARPPNGAATADGASVDGVPEESGGALWLLPELQELPIAADVFCAGLQRVLPTMQQNLAFEAAILCEGDTATQLLDELIASPYDGIGTPFLRRLNGGDAIPLQDVRNLVAYSIRVQKAAVPTILAEENIVKATSYSNANGFSIALAMDSVPPINDGDCDTAFRVAQTTTSTNRRARFSDVSKHDLKLYRLHPDNFDYLAAGRTLVEPTQQVHLAAILRGFMPDPSDSGSTIVFSVVHSVMNGRGFNAEVSRSFEAFLTSDIAAAYRFHINGN